MIGTRTFMFLLTPGTLLPQLPGVSREGSGPGMPNWARTFMLLTGMIAWVAVIVGQLWLKKTPDAWIIGFPAALWLALTGESKIARRRATRSVGTARDAATDQEGDSA